MPTRRRSRHVGARRSEACNLLPHFVARCEAPELAQSQGISPTPRSKTPRSYKLQAKLKAPRHTSTC